MKPKKVSRTSPRPPEEPTLDMLDIQGIAVPGFFKPHQVLLYLRIPDSSEVVQHFKILLTQLVDDISTADAALKDRRNFRAIRFSKAEKAKSKSTESVLTAIGFSSAGMKRLTPGAAYISSEAYQGGLVARSSLLGDPTDPGQPGHPSNWVVGGPEKELDAILIVAGDSRERVSTRGNELKKKLEDAGVSVDVEEGDIRNDMPGHEHFGFDDGISQPGIRGLASKTPGDFITDRHVALNEIPEAWLYGYPGQDLVWPGEFVLGYPATSPDPLIPGPITPTTPGWTRNGSYLVFRRLRQDVGLFWRTMRDEAERLNNLPGYQGMTAEHLAALLVGRWQSGAPVNRTPKKDTPALGGDPMANNYFLFDSDTPPLDLKSPGKIYDMAKADPVGTTCPLGAHIRKVNTRDSASDMGGRTSTYDRRLLRVGVPFGKPLFDKFAKIKDDPEKGNRGLLFLSIQASIERQFEFLQARWMNDPSRPKMPTGNDMIVGQNAAAASGVRKCPVFGSELQQAEIKSKDQWVVPTGGGYFFIPSISALRNVIAR